MSPSTLSLPLVLIGLPGSGKTTLAPVLAQKLGAAWIDTDQALEARFGHSISEIFSTLGEAGFRALEHQVVCDALESEAGVVALGGGAPTYRHTLAALDGATVVYLRVEAPVATERLLAGGEAGENGAAARPLLAGEGEKGAGEKWKELFRARDGLYRNLATLTVDASAEVDTVAGDIISGLLAQAPAPSAADALPIMVAAPRPYPIWVGENLRGQITQEIPARVNKALLIFASPLQAAAQELAAQIESERGIGVAMHQVPDGEAAKCQEVLAQCWDACGDSGLGRHDLVIGLGGGAVTDLAGFVAATWLRGVDVLQVPTSLLAMVDAAVGGKTGIDWKHGKNLVGAFHTPVSVLASLDYLHTLPPAELRAGLAEAIKCGYIANPEILSLAQNYPGELLCPGSEQLRAVVQCAIEVKAEVVSSDLTEAGRREILNYGHTFGHAIEKAENFSWRHGEAVAVGMVYAAELGAILGTGPLDLPNHLRAVLSSLGLPTTYSGAPFAELLQAMGADKKVRAGALRFVLLESIGHPLVQAVSELPALEEAARRVGVRS